MDGGKDSRLAGNLSNKWGGQEVLPLFRQVTADNLAYDMEDVIRGCPQVWRTSCVCHYNCRCITVSIDLAQLMADGSG